MLRNTGKLGSFLFACKKHTQSVQRIFPKTLPAAVGPYAPITIIGEQVFVSGQIPLNPDTGIIQAKNIQGQTHQVMKNIKAALQSVGCSFNDVAKTTILLTDMGFYPKVNQIYAQYFQNDKYPARVCYSVTGLPKNSLIQIDAIVYKKKYCQNNNSCQGNHSCQSNHNSPSNSDCQHHL